MYICPFFFIFLSFILLLFFLFVACIIFSSSPLYISFFLPLALSISLYFSHVFFKYACVCVCVVCDCLQEYPQV